MTIRRLPSGRFGTGQPGPANVIPSHRPGSYLIGRGAPLQTTGLASPPGSDVIFDQGVVGKEIPALHCSASAAAAMHCCTVICCRWMALETAKQEPVRLQVPERKPRPRPGALLLVLFLRALLASLFFRVKLSVGRTGLSAVPYYSRNQTHRPMKRVVSAFFMLPVRPFRLFSLRSSRSLVSFIAPDVNLCVTTQPRTSDATCAPRLSSPLRPL